jgi:hypothetical protein
MDWEKLIDERKRLRGEVLDKQLPVEPEFVSVFIPLCVVINVD